MRPTLNTRLVFRAGEHNNHRLAQILDTLFMGTKMVIFSEILGSTCQVGDTLPVYQISGSFDFDYYYLLRIFPSPTLTRLILIDVNIFIMAM